MTAMASMRVAPETAVRRIRRSDERFKAGAPWPMTGDMTWRRRLEPFTRPFFFAASRLTRGMTLGVRGLAIDAEGRVLLVEHTYLEGWWLPGGGVDRGETAQQAVIREMREETGLIATAPPRLVSVHANERFFRGDHVLVFRLEGWTMGERSSHGEIARIGWFAPDDLPEGTTRATRERLAEALGGADISQVW